jgi:hypothetical protein
MLQIAVTGPKTVTEMLVTISVDHRVYDGDTTGEYLYYKFSFSIFQA